MYTIEVLQNDLEHCYLYATDRQGLFLICWLLDHSEYIKQFMVYQDTNVSLPKHFGFGGLKKWVEKLDYTRS